RLSLPNTPARRRDQQQELDVKPAKGGGGESGGATTSDPQTLGEFVIRIRTGKSGGHQGGPPLCRRLVRGFPYPPRASGWPFPSPLPFTPITPAAPDERSMMRPPTYGPRSLIVTSTVLPLRMFLTRTLVPNGSVLWAAVIARGLNHPPEASRCGCQ